MTPEENAAKLRAFLAKKTPKTSEPDKLRAFLASKAAPEQPNPLIGGTRALLQGLTLNTADEIGAGASALGVKAADWLGFDMGEVGTLGEVYDSMTGELEAERDQYREDNPALSLGLELAGGVATGFSGAGKVLAGKALSKLKTPLARSLAAAAAEGTVAGAGGARKDEDLLSATGVGAGLATGLTGGFKALGSTGKALLKGGTNRRFAEDVVQKVDGQEIIRPLSQMPEDNIVSQFYKATAPAFGSNLPKQARAYSDAVTPKLSQQIGDITRPAKLRKDQLTKRDARLRKLSGRVQGANTAQAVEAFKRLDTAAPFTSDFKKKAFNAAAPEGAGVGDDLAAMNPVDAAEELRKVWKTDGFKVAKAADVDVDPNAMRRKISRTLDDMDADYAGDIMRRASRNAPKAPSNAQHGIAARRPLGAALSASRKPGTGRAVVNPRTIRPTKAPTPAADEPNITKASDLIDIRNSLRRVANGVGKYSGEDQVKRAAYAKAAGVVDDILLKELPEAARVNFLADKQAWNATSTLFNATNKAKDRAGDFTPRDWVGAIKDITGAQRAPLKRESIDAMEATRAAEATAKDAFTATKAGIVDASRTRLDKSLKQADRLKQASQRRADAPNPELDALRAERSVLQTQANRNPTLFNRIMATGMSGVPGFAVGGLPGAIASGVAGAKTVSNPGIQKAMAGQTGVQERMARLLKEYEDSALQGNVGDISRALRTGVSAAAN